MLEWFQSTNLFSHSRIISSFCPNSLFRTQNIFFPRISEHTFCLARLAYMNVQWFESSDGVFLLFYINLYTCCYSSSLQRLSVHFSTAYSCQIIWAGLSIVRPKYIDSDRVAIYQMFLAASPNCRTDLYEPEDLLVDCSCKLYID